MRVVNDLARLRICTGSPEPPLLADTIKLDCNVLTYETILHFNSLLELIDCNYMLACNLAIKEDTVSLKVYYQPNNEPNYYCVLGFIWFYIN